MQKIFRDEIAIHANHILHFMGWPTDRQGATLPYRRSLQQYTLKPIDKIQECGSDVPKMLKLVEEWKKIKKDELRAVQLAVSASVPINCVLN
jgi:hypothetical protein